VSQPPQRTVEDRAADGLRPAWLDYLRPRNIPRARIDRGGSRRIPAAIVAKLSHVCSVRDQTSQNRFAGFWRDVKPIDVDQTEGR